MESQKKHNSLMEQILSVYKKCNIRALPVNCFSVIEKYGFRLYTYAQLKEQNEHLYNLVIAYSKDSITFGDIIIYNEKQAKRRIPFSIMHEFGHYILGHKDETPENEDEADEFASNILAPRILIHKYSCRDAIQIHDTFGLSYQASNRALMSYKKWFRNISCSATSKPTEPEQQLERIFFPESNLVPLMEGIVQPAKGCYSDEDEDDYSELNERSDFMKFLSRWRGDRGFGLAENKWLYGNDF